MNTNTNFISVSMKIEMFRLASGAYLVRDGVGHIDNENHRFSKRNINPQSSYNKDIIEQEYQRRLNLAKTAA